MVSNGLLITMMILDEDDDSKGSETLISVASVSCFFFFLFSSIKSMSSSAFTQLIQLGLRSVCFLFFRPFRLRPPLLLNTYPN